MWKSISLQRNQYLQKIFEDSVMDPLVLTNSLEIAMHQKFPYGTKPIPSCHGLMNLEPDCFDPDPVTQRSRLAYGLWGIPKLIVEMTSQDGNVQRRALYSLAEELKDECKCYRAIEEFEIAKRFNTALVRYVTREATDTESLECLLECIGLVSTHFHGANKIFAEYGLVNNIYDMIVDKKCVSRNAANALYRMSTHSTVADLMISDNHITKVLDVLVRVDDLDDVYLILANLIERSRKKALAHDVIEALLPQVLKRENLLSSSMKCFALSLKEADKHVYSVTLVTILYEMLADDDLPLNILEYSALALMNIIFKTDVLWKCREIWDLPLVLIKRASNKHSDEMQLWCLQALRQLIMMPSIRNFVRKTAKKQVKNIVCHKGYVERVKNDLLKQLRKNPFSTAPLKDSETP